MRLLATLALAFMLAAPRAHAQPSNEVKTAARSLLDEGDRRIERNDIAGALDAYQKADALMHVPTTTIEVAKTQARLGKLVAARASANAVLSFPREAQEPEPFSIARKEAAELLAALESRIPSVVVVVSGPQPNAITLMIDGTLRDPHATHLVDPGIHEILVSAEGFIDGRKRLGIAEGSRIKVALAMDKRPLPFVQLMATGSVATGVGLAFGIGFGAVSWTKTSDIEAQCVEGQCDPSLANDISEAEAFANVSNVGFAFAGAGAIMFAVGLGMYLTEDASPPVRPTASGFAIAF
jgi:hypothetical protein